MQRDKVCSPSPSSSETVDDFNDEDGDESVLKYAPKWVSNPGSMKNEVARPQSLQLLHEVASFKPPLNLDHP